jgi:phage portal protein BeeE
MKLAFWKKKQQPQTPPDGLYWPSDFKQDLPPSPKDFPLLVAGLEKIAFAVSSARLFLEKAGERTYQHPFLELLKRPNPLAAFPLLYYMALSWEGHGEVIVWVDRRARFPVLWPIEPRALTYRPKKLGEPWQFLVQGGVAVSAPAEDVLVLERPFVDSFYSGRAWVLEALRDEVALAESALRYSNGWFDNNGIPPLIVAEPTVEESRIPQYEARWLERVRGLARRHVPFFMRGKPDIVPIDNKPPDAVPVLYKTAKDSVVQALGIPPEILGIVENSNRATAEAAIRIFITTTVEPRVSTFVAGLQRIVNVLAPGYALGYDPLLPEENKEVLDFIKTHPWVATRNEIRALLGLPEDPEKPGTYTDKNVMEL